MDKKIKINKIGLCKIISINNTTIKYGSNQVMRKCVGQVHTYKYEYNSYYIIGYMWDKNDIQILNEDGNIILTEKQSFPKPKQFNPDFLDI